LTVLDEVLKDYWYYTMEVAEGVFSNGGNHPNIVPTRHLLSKIDPSGAKVFDFGTMEAMVPILLSRRGANVTAVDAGDFTRKIEHLKQAYGVQFEYHPRVSLHNTKEFLRNKHVFEGFLQPSNPPRGYDMVVLSGVLYHVFNPLETMALARTLLRSGGLLVLETATSIRDEYAQYWNYNHGWLYPNGTNTWFLTARLLDHLLRFLRFKVIDVAHIDNVNDVKRLAVIAQATDDLLVAPGEEQWFEATTRNFDYDFFCDLEYAQGKAKILPISDPLGPRFYHAGIESVDVHLAAMMRPPLAVEQDKVRLRLGDQI
jgi:2-polyprenyl-3-methyl-5-hydroxy-6-metoxy-1,4-benzoquinol methylase